MSILAGGCWIPGASETQQTVERLIQAVEQQCSVNQKLLYPSAAMVSGLVYPTSTERIVPIQDRASRIAGFGVGWVFRRDVAVEPGRGQPWSESISADALISTRGSYLTAHVWGNYAMACWHEQAEELHLFSNPVGALTLYWMRLPDGWAFATNAAVLVEALAQPPDIDWEYVSSFIQWGYYPTWRTPFRQICMIEPGLSLRLSAQRSQTHTFPFWRPDRLLVHNADRDENALVGQVAQVAETTLSTWSHQFQGLSVSLSGGLDSSMLLALLQQHRPDGQVIQPFHINHTGLAFVDESRYAQQAADALQLQLIQLPAEQLLPLMPSAAPLPRFGLPSSRLLTQYANSQIQALDDTRQSSAVFDGRGGDVVFYQPIGKHMVGYLDQGWRLFVDELLATARFSTRSIFRIISGIGASLSEHRHAKRAGFAAYNWTFDHELRNWLHPDVRRDALTDSWTVAAYNLSSLSPLQAWRLAVTWKYTALLMSQIDHEERIPRLSPLFSQPLLEVGLQLPVPLLVRNGYNRVAWRQLTERYLPREIAWRRSKGRITSVLLLAYRRYRQRIETLLLNGRLVREGIVRREILAKDLAAFFADTSGQPPLPRLAELLLMELWFEAWDRR